MPKNSERMKALLEQVHETEDSFVKAVAMRHTVENLGMPWPEYNSLGRLLEAHMDGVDESQEGEMERGLREEHKHWLGVARETAAKLMARQLPFTLENAEREWLK